MLTRRHVIASALAAPAILKLGTGTAHAATALKITAQDLLDLKIIDGIVPEPVAEQADSIATESPKAIAAVGRLFDALDFSRALESAWAIVAGSVAHGLWYSPRSG